MQVDVFAFDSLGIYLSSVLEQKKRINPRVSLRGWARSLELDSSSLARVLSGARALPIRHLDRVAKKLQLDGAQLDYFRALNEAAGGREQNAFRLKRQSREVRLEADRFRAIADWQHWAVMQLARGGRLTRFTRREAAERLGIPPRDLAASLARLRRLGLLRLEHETYRRTHERVVVASEAPNEAIQEYYRRAWARGIEDVGQGDLAAKFIGAETMTFDPAAIEEAKAVLDEAFDRLLALSSRGEENAQEVYQLNLHFFPLTKRG